MSPAEWSPCIKKEIDVVCILRYDVSAKAMTATNGFLLQWRQHEHFFPNWWLLFFYEAAHDQWHDMICRRFREELSFSIYRKFFYATLKPSFRELSLLEMLFFSASVKCTCRHSLELNTCECGKLRATRYYVSLSTDIASFYLMLDLLRFPLALMVQC